jgi:hypothetical protein
MKYDQLTCAICVRLFIRSHIPSQIENVYLTELHNAISNQEGDLRNAINCRNISDVIGGVCIIRNGRNSHRDVLLPSNVRYERRIGYSFEIQNVS